LLIQGALKTSGICAIARPIVLNDDARVPAELRGGASDLIPRKIFFLEMKLATTFPILNVSASAALHQHLHADTCSTH
jgi:hypothetical protein